MKVKFDLMKMGIRTGGVAGGAIAGTAAMKYILPSVPTWMKATGLIVIGNVPTLFQKGEKQTILNHLGDGLVAAGAIALTNALTGGAISGVEDVMSGVGAGETRTIDEDYESDNVSGTTEEDDEISGTDDVVGDVGNDEDSDEEGY